MRAHIPACERPDHTARPFLTDDREVASRGRASENAEAIGGIRAAMPPDDRRLEDLFDLIQSDPVAGQVLDIVIVPLELDPIHGRYRIDIVNTQQQVPAVAAGNLLPSKGTVASSDGPPRPPTCTLCYRSPDGYHEPAGSTAEGPRGVRRCGQAQTWWSGVGNSTVHSWTSPAGPALLARSARRSSGASAGRPRWTAQASPTSSTPSSCNIACQTAARWWSTSPRGGRKVRSVPMADPSHPTQQLLAQSAEDDRIRPPRPRGTRRRRRGR